MSEIPASFSLHYAIPIKFTFNHLAETFIQSDVQKMLFEATVSMVAYTNLCSLYYVNYAKLEIEHL